MLCKIADLLVEIPEAGGMAPRCRDYLTDEISDADIRIREDLYGRTQWPDVSEENYIYMDSGWQFYCRVLAFRGLMLHASAVALDGKGYLFSGPSGMGKSTHTRLWQKVFGSSAQVFNDDKPALRRLDDRWYAYGTPWCGKDGININMTVPLGGICFLKRGESNAIRRLSSPEALAAILTQTTHRFSKEENLDVLLRTLDDLIREIPVWELTCRPDEDAARLSYETMCCGTEGVI